MSKLDGRIPAFVNINNATAQQFMTHHSQSCSSALERKNKLDSPVLLWCGGIANLRQFFVNVRMLRYCCCLKLGPYAFRGLHHPHTPFAHVRGYILVSTDFQTSPSIRYQEEKDSVEKFLC